MTNTERTITLTEVTNNLKDSFHEIINFIELDRKSVTNLNRWLKENKCRYKRKMVTLYHGTASRHDILKEGIKTTKARTKRSLQSTTGYTYLSMYPDSAKTFASMAYPQEGVCVYAVEVPLMDLLPDKDQLFNARMWKGENIEIKNTLGDSLVFGNGARLKRDIQPYEVKLVTEPN